MMFIFLCRDAFIPWCYSKCLHSWVTTQGGAWKFLFINYNLSECRMSLIVRQCQNSSSQCQKDRRSSSQTLDPWLLNCAWRLLGFDPGLLNCGCLANRLGLDTGIGLPGLLGYQANGLGSSAGIIGWDTWLGYSDWATQLIKSIGYLTIPSLYYPSNHVSQFRLAIDYHTIRGG